MGPLKGQSNKIFNLHFFHNLNLPGPLNKVLKYFIFSIFFFTPWAYCYIIFLVRALYPEPRNRPYEIRIFSILVKNSPVWWYPGESSPRVWYPGESISLGYVPGMISRQVNLLGIIPRRVNLPRYHTLASQSSPSIISWRVNKNLPKHDSPGYHTPASQSHQGKSVFYK